MTTRANFILRTYSESIICHDIVCSTVYSMRPEDLQGDTALQNVLRTCVHDLKHRITTTQETLNLVPTVHYLHTQLVCTLTELEDALVCATSLLGEIEK